MRGLSQPHNAEGSDHPTETEERTMRKGCTEIKQEGREGRVARGELWVLSGDSGTPSSRFIKIKQYLRRYAC